MLEEHEDMPLPPIGKSCWPWTEQIQQLPAKRSDGSPWPRISIVTPSYNQGQYIEQTIRSVLLQGYPNLEYVIVDGQSTDKTEDVLKKYAPFLTHVIREPDRGQTDALNKGFALTTGEILGYINSDDWYAPDAFRLVAECYMNARKQEFALICGSVQDSMNGTAGMLHRPTGLGRIHQWFYGGISLHQPGCFWSRGIWNECGSFPTGMHYVFDRYFFARVCASGKSTFIGVPEVLAYFRHHDESKTISNEELFVREWGQARDRLERLLPWGARVKLRYHRWLRTNWHVAKESLEADTTGRSVEILWRHIRERPSAVLHRPILGATRRLIKRCIGKLL